MPASLLVTLGRDVLPRPHAQRADHDGHAGRDRHAGRQLGRDHREHLPAPAARARTPGARDARGRARGRCCRAGRHAVDDHRLPADGVRREERDVDLPGARRDPDHRRDGGVARRRADTDPDAGRTHDSAAAGVGAFLVRPAAASLRAGDPLGARAPQDHGARDGADPGLAGTAVHAQARQGRSRSRRRRAGRCSSPITCRARIRCSASSRR